MQEHKNTHVVTVNRVLADYTIQRLNKIKDFNLEGEFIDCLISSLKEDENLTLYDVVKEFNEDLELEET